MSDLTDQIDKLAERISAAKEFLQGVINAVDAAVDEAFRQVQNAGREAFKQTLAKDYDFWRKCEVVETHTCNLRVGLLLSF